VERVGYILAKGELDESSSSPEKQIELLTQVLDVAPDSHEFRLRRGQLYEALFRWDEAVADYQTALAADPENHWDRYHLGTTLLYKGDVEEHRQLCHDMIAKWGDSTEPRIQERTAKLCLLLPVEGEDFETALRLIDEAYENDREGTYGSFDVLAKGIAEYRRGRFTEAIEHFDQSNANFDEGGGSRVINAAKGDLFAAMAHHQLGEIDTARARFAAALSRIDTVYFEYIRTHRVYSHDWLMAEIARREAQALLGISEEQVGVEPADTADWKLLFEDDFERSEVGDAWTVDSGEWAIEEGALVGTLTASDFRSNKGAWILLSAAQIPNWVEVEYDLWWPEPTSMELKLMNADSSVGYVAGLSGFEHPARLNSFPNESPTGPQMLIRDPDMGTAAYRFIARDPQIEMETNRRYHIRVLLQPRRLTMYLDGEQVLSERVYELDAPVLKLYGYGPDRSRIYVDNLKVRVPPRYAALSKARSLGSSGEFDEAAAAWRDVIVSEPYNDRFREEAAQMASEEIADRLWETLPADLKPIWKAAAGRPLAAEGTFQQVDLQPHANVTLKGNFHVDGDGGLTDLPQGLREFGGVPFAIGPKGLHLRGELGSERVQGYPEEISGIQAGTRFQRLHLLHAVGWGADSWVEDGTTVGKVILRYADGSLAELDIVKGEHVRDWFDRDEPPTPHATIAWTLSTESFANSKFTRRLYATAWENPHPDRQVQSIDYVSTMTNSSPFCVAMTLELGPAEDQ
jgi:tetratricopeptide (TPR) repeat protein